MATQWKEHAYYNFGEGMYRTTSPADPKFPDQAVYDALNMVYEGDSDNLSTMYGATRLGTTDMGGILSGLFDHDSGSKLIASCEDGKIYEYGADWAASSGARATGNSTTTGVRWAHEMFYGATTAKNLSILTNGVDAPIKYETAAGASSLGGSPPATGNFPVSWQGRLWLFSGSTAYYSAPNNCEDWTTAGGGGSIEIYRGTDGAITGAAAFANNLIIFKRSSTYRIVPSSTYTSINVLNVNSAKGCVSHHTIQEVAGSDMDALVWWSEHGIESIQPSDVQSAMIAHDISSWIHTIAINRNLQHMSKGWALYNMERMEYFTSYPAGVATNPNAGLIGNFAKKSRRPRWTRHDRVSLTCGVTYNAGNTAYIQYVGDINGRVYKMHDETTNLWLGANWLRRIQTKYYTLGAPNRMKRLGHSFVAAESVATSTVTVKQNMLRQNLNNPTAPNTTTLTNLGNTGGWGVGKWGQALWGGSGFAGQRIRPPSFQRGFGLAHLIETNTSFFRLRGIVVASKMLSNKPY